MTNRMADQKTFGIAISAPYTMDSFLAPEDPLGELTEAEMNFRTFCFGRNQVVTVKVAEKQEKLLLFPDVALAFAELRDAPRQLQQGLSVELHFPESACRLALRPDADFVECRLEEFGARSDSAACQAGLADTVDALTRFTDDVLARAVDAGYLTPDQARQLG
jgi:hypothetical protein